ncbi:hypothetical protein [Falsiroseomonas bella]|uniref:hypothetical protein n=1 Tax=Falsiroseomonas bella TaxID=2184016 RepID=UPI0011B79781|nr:hypothetical protein [Falsiroseomonas bella]
MYADVIGAPAKLPGLAEKNVASGGVLAENAALRRGATEEEVRRLHACRACMILAFARAAVA